MRSGNSEDSPKSNKLVLTSFVVVVACIIFAGKQFFDARRKYSGPWVYIGYIQTTGFFDLYGQLRSQESPCVRLGSADLGLAEVLARSGCVNEGVAEMTNLSKRVGFKFFKNKKLETR